MHEVAILLLSLGLLMLVAYRGWSVILFAPLCALLAVLLSLGPAQVLPFYSGVFMEKLVAFLQLYFPVFMLGALFGKLIELSGAASAIARSIVRLLGPQRAIPAIVLACALLTYGGVSLFVVAFAVYPFAASLFRQARLPKRLIPGAIALGAFTFTMDALPGSPQIQNVIPTTFFGTTLYAAPVLGVLGALVVGTLGLAYLEWQRRRAGEEGYGEGHRNEPDLSHLELGLPPVPVALLPLLTVALVNRLVDMKRLYPDYPDIGKVASIWSIELALVAGILVALAIGWSKVQVGARKGLESAVAGSLLAALNTASEYGFGAVIAALPGFAAVKAFIGSAFANPLLNEAVSVNVLAGITGSASGGMSIALATMGSQYLAAAQQAGISPEVLHRVASMASGGMDTLPHNGAVITLLVITGLSHRESYKDIFALTCLKTLSVFVVIAIYCLTGWV